MKLTLLLAAIAFVVTGACDQQQDLGRSIVPSCREGLTSCGSGCVDTFSNPEHCGGCGLACPSGKLCQSGACVSSCSQPNSACGASCVTLYEDDLHCGACNNPCGDTQHCDNNTCRSCATGNTFCLTANRRSWRCVNFAIDKLNCGGCGLSCANGQQCVSGACR